MAWWLLGGVSVASALSVWLLLGWGSSTSGLHRVSRERLRLRLMGHARRLALSRAAVVLSRITPLEEVGIVASRWLSRQGFDVGVAASCVFVAGISILVVAVCGVIAQSWIGLVVGTVAVCTATASFGSSLRRARHLAMEREMPRVFRSLAGSLAAGRTLPQALACLGKNQELSSEAYGRAALAMACGYSASDALMQLSHELETSGGELLVSALLVSHRTGSPLMGLFQRAALIIERDGELERLLNVKTAQVKLSVRVVCVLPAVMVGFLALISPDFREGITTPAGQLSLGLAIVLDLLAVWIVHRLIASVI